LKKSFAEESIELAGFGLIIAFVMYTFFPAYTILAKLLLTASFGGVAFYAQTWSKFNKVFKALNLGSNNSFPLLKIKKKFKGYNEYTFTLPHGISVEDFKKHKEAISQFAGADLDFEYRFKNLIVKEYLTKLKDKYEFEYLQTKEIGEVPILYTKTGELKTLKLFKGDHPNCLICSEAGGGKSTLLRSMITQLILQNKCELFLVDLKRGAEFGIFRNCEKVKSFAKTKAEAYKLITIMDAECDRRYDLISDNNCIDIQEFNKKHKPLTYQVLIIDEFAGLAEEDDSIELLRLLAGKCRASGIRLIISTQRPSSDILDGVIKANISNIVGLKVINEINARIIGIKGLEKLQGRGHAIFRHETEEIEGRCPLLEPERARELVKPFEIDKKKESKEEIPNKIISLDFMKEFENGH
jgi:DNA segregation ATPase FtsK/SpoIIIE, S-DNA-T family